MNATKGQTVRHVRDPIGVYVAESLAGIYSLRSLERADKDAVWSKEVLDRGAFCKELGIGEDVKPAAVMGIGLENGAHALGCPARHGGFLHYNF